MEFIELWLKTLHDYPITSLNATLYNTKGFWYLFDTHKGAATDFSWSPLIDLNFELGYNDETNQDLREQNIDQMQAGIYLTYQDHLFPQLMVLDCIPFYFWLFVLCIFVLLIRRDRPTLISLAGIFGVIVTAFAGPVADGRYLFCLQLIAPILFAFIFNRSATETDEAIPES
jgi:hypothetical protein